MLGIPAVVVGNGEDVAARCTKSGIAGPGQTWFGALVPNCETMMSTQQRQQAVVRILVNHHDFKITVTLLFES